MSLLIHVFTTVNVKNQLVLPLHCKPVTPCQLNTATVCFALFPASLQFTWNNRFLHVLERHTSITLMTKNFPLDWYWTRKSQGFIPSFTCNNNDFLRRDKHWNISWVVKICHNLSSRSSQIKLMVTIWKWNVCQIPLAK